MSTDTSGKKPPAKSAPFVKQAGAGAIKTIEDLNTALKGYSSAKNKPLLKAQLIKAAKRLKATHRLPKGWTGAKTESALEEAALTRVGMPLATIGHIECPGDDCARWFLHEDKLFEHADLVHPTVESDEGEAMHTFSDIEEMVREAVREKYYKAGDYRATPPVQTIWAWVRDIADDWVVFVVEKEGDETLYKASYSITDNEVTLGEPTEVVRKTVYEPAKKES